MNNFSWSKALIFGALIWLIMFAASAAIVGFGAVIGTGWGIALALVVGVLSYLFAIGAGAENSGQAWGYGVLFTLVGIVLDVVVSARFHTGIFSLWTYWAGYALVLLAPWLEYEMQGKGAHQHTV